MKDLAHIRREKDVSSDQSSREAVSGEHCNLRFLDQAIELRVEDIILGKAVRPIDHSKISQIAASIRDQGLHQPIHVYELNDTQRGKFGLAAGRHRLLALDSLGYKTVPAVVISRRKAKAWRYSENLHRSGLRALEMSQAIVGYATERQNLPDVEEVLPKGGKQPRDKGYSKLAKAMGFNRKRIAEAFQHDTLPNSVKDRVRKHARLNRRRILNALIALVGEKAQLKFLKRELRLVGTSKERAFRRRRNDWLEPNSKEKKATEDSGCKVSAMKRLVREWKTSKFRKLYAQQKASVQKRFVEKYM